jgi:hypothetical protein
MWAVTVTNTLKDFCQEGFTVGRMHNKCFKLCEVYQLGDAASFKVTSESCQNAVNHAVSEEFKT